MQQTIENVRNNILDLPFGSMVFVEVSEKDGAKLELEQMKLSALNSLLKSYEADSQTFKEILKEYEETFASYLSTVYCAISEMLGEEIIGPLSNPCWEIGYNSVNKKIYLYKDCPKKYERKGQR